MRDARALYEKCIKHGVWIIKGLKDKDYRLKPFVFEDADGNRIDLGQHIESEIGSGVHT